MAKNPKFLGAQTGAVAVLHTWGQALTYHPHIHMIVPAGGLSADGIEWVRAGRKFFLPVKALSKVFRGVIWGLLEKQVTLGNIRLPDDMAELTILKTKLYQKDWNVYAKKSAAEFIGKFMRHILPFGFYKIRYYGLLASANGAKRQQCILLIAKQPHAALLQGLSVQQVLKMLIGKDPDRCPKCKKGKMIPVALLHSG